MPSINKKHKVSCSIQVAWICLFLLSLHHSSIAQTKIFGGVSVPISDFASIDSVSGGFAKTGFSIGAEYTSKSFLGSEMGISCIVGYYPINLAALANNRLRLRPGSPVESGAWILIWPQASLGYRYPLSNIVTMFGRGYGGLFYGVYPEVTIIDAGVTRYTQNLSIKLAFGWGAGIGVAINKKYDLEIRFLSSRPDYDLNTAGGNLLTTETSTIDTKTIQIMVGYIF